MPAPTAPTLQPTVDRMESVCSASMSPCDDEGHDALVGTHAESRDDFAPRASTPKTVPTAMPAAPTPRTMYPGVRFGGDAGCGAGEGGCAVVARGCGSGATTGGAPA